VTALFCNVTVSFVTWQPCVVAVSENCWKREVAHLGCCCSLPLYLTQSAIDQSESYYFQLKTVGAASSKNEVGGTVAPLNIFQFHSLDIALPSIGKSGKY